MLQSIRKRDIPRYLANAEHPGVPVRHVFLIRFHAGFIAGHLEWRDRCGADIRLGSQARRWAAAINPIELACSIAAWEAARLPVVTG